MSTSCTILETHPRRAPDNLTAVLAQCLDACRDCAQSCTQCADACLSEPSVDQLAVCIAVNLDCADVCAVTANVNARLTGFDSELAKAMLAGCAVACRVCGAECERHAAHHQHCKACSDQCRDCEQACRDLIAALG